METTIRLVLYILMYIAMILIIIDMLGNCLLKKKQIKCLKLMEEDIKSTIKGNQEAKDGEEKCLVEKKIKK